MDPNELYDVEEASKCLRFLRLLWKFSRCIFSHVTLVSLVVAYCVLGAYAFESLEAEHEKEVKRSIRDVRSNVTQDLWKMTQGAQVLIQENWTSSVVDRLRVFETELLRKMKKDGWDGNEEEDNIQWTFAGALFYSIIVITTIGYGHIAPKTQNGKIVTIFYAILGIPLMLLCLSNIGDVMASSFRFLYWKICCYICTRPPKPRRSRHANMLARSQSQRYSGRYTASNRSTVAATSFRRSVRASQRSADSGLSPTLSESMTRSSHSDTDCSRYGIQHPDAFGLAASGRGGGSFKGTSARGPIPGQRSNALSPHRLSPINSIDAPVGVPSRYLEGSNTSPRVVRVGSRGPPTGTRSLDRKSLVSNVAPNDAERTPVLCNKYAVDEPDIVRQRSLPPLKGEPNVKEDYMDSYDPELIEGEEVPAGASTTTRIWSAPRRCRSVEGPSGNDRSRAHHIEMIRAPRSSSLAARRARSQRREAPSARIMSPMGFAVHRQVYVDDLELDYDHLTSTEEHDARNTAIKPVPIWLCVFLVVSYIFGGAFLFSEWEHWLFLDSAYFCFITLTTIGFGDFVPAHRLNAHQGIALCSLYLLFGIALLAMSFNLVQEEVINNVKNVAKRLGIIKEDREDDDNDEFEPDIDNEHYLLNREGIRYGAEYDRPGYVYAPADEFADRFPNQLPRRALYRPDSPTFRYAS